MRVRRTENSFPHPHVPLQPRWIWWADDTVPQRPSWHLNYLLYYRINYNPPPQSPRAAHGPIGRGPLLRLQLYWATSTQLCWRHWGAGRRQRALPAEPRNIHYTAVAHLCPGRLLDAFFPAHHGKTANMSDYRVLSPLSSASSRSQGWQPRRFGDLMEGPVPQLADVRRWDGAARRSYEWDSLRRVSRSAHQRAANSF